jgi:predicted acetyltransferase
MEPVLRHPETDEEAAACWQLLVRAFGFPRDDTDSFVEKLDKQRALAVFVGTEVAAFSRIRPFGQFWGGRRVAMGGHSPVGASPEFRGRGFGSMVTAGHFEDLRDRGEPIAGLHPASTALYRGVGFGLAGVWAHHKVPARSLQMLRPTGAVTRRGTADDIPAVKDLYRAHAPRHDGHLDRPDVWWERFFEKLDQDTYLYVVDGERPGTLAGYVIYHQGARPEGWGYRIVVQDMVAPEVDVAHALYRLLGSSSTMTDNIYLRGPNEHPLLLMLPEQDLVPEDPLRFMVRIVDMAGAFEARGYAPGTNLAADFELEDKDCPWNTGRWRLTVEDGHPAMAKGGSGSIKATPTALATLFSGYMSAWDLSAAGALSGAAERDLQALAHAFAGPTPWMPEIF